MNKSEIRDHLSYLGISSLKKLESKDIDYWWQNKFREIQSSNLNADKKREYLTDLNNRRDILNELDIEVIKKSFFNRRKEQFNQSNESNSYKKNSSRNRSEDSNSYSKKSNEYKKSRKNGFWDLMTQPNNSYVWLAVITVKTIVFLYNRYQN